MKTQIIAADLGGAKGDFSMEHKTRTKALSWLLSLAMLFSLVPGVSLTAYAAEPINLSTLTDNYTANDGDVLTGTLGGNYKISIADGATVTLNDVIINGTNDTNCRWAGITCEGDATIILSGTNIVKGFYYYYPGISVPVEKTLTIKGSGSLTASPFDGGGTENSFGAGIGAFYQNNSTSFACGNIVIEGGTINARGGKQGAGIGGAYYNGCGNITITGGTVTATGGKWAPGIGGGFKTGGGNITITGGTITATGGEKCPGIGAQRGSFTPNLGDITITDGVTSVTATGGNLAPYSIGASTECSCGTITIGGTVTGNISTNPYTYPLPHTHSFTYSASGDTITATCSAAANHADNQNFIATLSIGAPANLAIDDTAKAAVITDENQIQGTATVSYYAADASGNKTGSALTEAPTAAGTYWAEITLGADSNTATAHVVYEITNPEYNITLPTDLVGGTVTADKTSARYGDTVTLTVTPETGFTTATSAHMPRSSRRRGQPSLNRPPPLRKWGTIFSRQRGTPGRKRRRSRPRRRRSKRRMRGSPSRARSSARRTTGSQR